MTEQWKSEVPVSPSTMELPKKPNGEVDWHTLGNILVAHVLGEVVCASYIDNKFGKQPEGFVPVTSWKFAYEEKNVVVLMKDLEDSLLKCFMGRSVIDLPPKVVHECISANENAKYWDKYVVDSRKIKVLRKDGDVEDSINYMQCEARQCLIKSRRDFLFYARNQFLDIGKYVVTVLSVDYPSCPPVAGVDRGQLNLGSGWVLEPYNGDPSRTLVSYLMHANLVGLPTLVINRAIRRQPLNIHYLSRHLLKPADTTTPTKRFTLFSKPKTKTDPDNSVATPCIPTPDTFYDPTGYTFSAVPLGSNPLYNWSVTTSNSASTACKEKNESLEISFEDDIGRSGGTENGNGRSKLEESESILDFRVTSMESGGSERRMQQQQQQRPGYLWLPSLRNLESQGLVQCPPATTQVPPPTPPPPGVSNSSAEEEVVATTVMTAPRQSEGTDVLLPSSDCCDANCKRQIITQSGAGLATRE